MAQEPNIPLTDGDGIKTPPEAGEQKDPQNNDSNVGKSGEGEKEPKQSGDDAEESSKVTEEQYKQLVDGWKEDRDYYKGEIKRLRSEANNPKMSQSEEAELEGLDENERVEKIIKFREERAKKADEAELKAVKGEVRFYERTSKEFADNKKSILKVAQDYDCRDLKQAILLWKGLSVDKAKKDADYNDKRKKGADGKAGGKAGGKPVATKTYDPKVDKKKSFGDHYREGGV